MKKIIFGILATFMIASSALANGITTNAMSLESVNTTNFDLEAITTKLDYSLDLDAFLKRYCVVTVNTYKGDKLVKSEKFTIEVDNSEDRTKAQAQCQAIKAAFIAALD